MDHYRKALELLTAGRRFALALVVDSTGSTPQKAGAAALFEAAGPVHGTLGGGCLEAECRQRALRALDTGEPCTFDLRLDDIDGWDDALICGGKVRVFVDPNPASNGDSYRLALAAGADRRAGALVTTLRHGEASWGAARWIEQGSQDNGGLAPEAREAFTQAMAQGKPRRVQQPPGNGAGEFEFFIEPVVAPPRLIIAGAGHVGKAVARHGHSLGFDVTIIDDRSAFANPENVPEAGQVICAGIADTVAALPKDRDTYIVIVTRGHRNDGKVLAACVQSGAGYIGMIGSRRKALLIKNGLLEEGRATEAQLARVHCPVGLDIGAETVEEIAVSIAAELVAARRKAAVPAAAPS